MTFGVSAIRNFSYPTGYTGPSKPASAGASAFDQALEALKEEAAKTPAERARDAVLKCHGLDDKSYAAMSPDNRKLIDQEIADAVQRSQKAGGSRSA